MGIFGDELIKLITEKIKLNFEEKLFEIIEYLDVKDEIIKTAIIKKKIERGLQIKNELNDLIHLNIRSYFNDAIKQHDHLSIKKQKAISFLTLKGYNVSHIKAINGGSEFLNLQLFDSDKKGDEFFGKECFIVKNINIIEDSNELEILVQNNTNEDRENVITTINHVEEYFEKEILQEEIDFWFQGEEILFISPILPRINEYLLFIIDKKTNEKCLSKKIDISLVNKIKS